MSVLDRAKEIVSGPRQDDYGPPNLNHGCTAAMFSAYLSRKIGTVIVLDAEDVCWFNILQKISRQINRRKADNVLDVVGYAENIDRMSGPPKEAP